MNRRQFNLTVGTVVGQAAIPAVALAARRLPDLIVTAVRWSDDHGITFHSGAVLSGAQLMFQADVENIGTAAWSPLVVLGVAFRVNGAMAAWSDTHRDGLVPGATVTLTSNGGPDGDAFWLVGEPGSYTVRAVADDINRAREINDKNNTREVTLLVEPADEPLVANDDTLETPVDTPAEVDVLANDQGPPDMRVSAVQSPTIQGGQAVVLEDGRTVRYTPPPGFSGADQFTYEVSTMSAISGAAAVATASVSAAVGALPDLIVTAVRWSENDGGSWHTGNVQSTSNIWFEADIQNQGAGATPDGTILGVRWRINGATVAWSDTHTTSLGASQSVSLRANSGPDADKFWNTPGAATYSLLVEVDDQNLIAESNETNNSLSQQITVEGAAAGDQITIGMMSGGGNLSINDSANAQYKVPDLVALHCKMARIRADPAGYWSSAPTPSNYDSTVLLCLTNGIRPHLSFNYTQTNTTPNRSYSTWFSIGSAFAARFKPNSTFLTGQGISNSGVYSYSAINEPDSVSTLPLADYFNILHGFADGIKSQDANAKVFPSGYLSANRDLEFTGNGYCAHIASLINDGTLDGIDLHTYHRETGAKIHDTWARSHQHDMDEFCSQSGINMRAGLMLTSTEGNVRGDPAASADNYASVYPGTGLTSEQVCRNWFLTAMFDVLGAVRPDGSYLPGGPRFPWNLWQQSAEDFWMASSNNPRVPRFGGHTYKLIMDLCHDMYFTFNDPRNTGVYKLKGGGKSAWVYQGIHTSWTSLFGNTFTISDIPAGTTQVQVYDGNGLVQTVSTPTLQIPSHSFSTHRTNYPANMGKTLLFIGNAE